MLFSFLFFFFVGGGGRGGIEWVPFWAVLSCVSRGLPGGFAVLQEAIAVYF